MSHDNEEESENEQSVNVLPDLTTGEDNVMGEVDLSTQSEMDPSAQRITALPKTLQEIAEANPDAFQPAEDKSNKPPAQSITPAKLSKSTNSVRKTKPTPKAVRPTRRQKRPRSESDDSQTEELDDEGSDVTINRRRKVMLVAAAPSARVLRPRKPKPEEAFR